MKKPAEYRQDILSLWKSSTTSKTVPIVGTSMRPLVVAGDTVTFQPLSHPGRIRIGDIVVFRLEQTLVVHRIIDICRKKNGCFFKEKGDNRFFPTCIPAEAVIGRVYCIHKTHGTIDLTRRGWVLINTVAGYYWKILFRFFDTALYVKKRVFGAKKYPALARFVRRLVIVIGSIPTRLFGFRRQ